MSSITVLKDLYAKTSKHSNYQILSDKLATIIGTDQIIVKSRYERERLDYVLSKINFEEKSILDIGGNSGFFTFEAIEKGAKRVHHYEGNKAHSVFVKKAAEILGCINKIAITNGYYSFKNIEEKYDLVLLLNVLHHLGDDYGDGTLSIDEAKDQMATQLNSMARTTNHLIFQLGFNWKGNRNICLFKNGTKRELIDFVTEYTNNFWEIQNIGIPVKTHNKITYADLDDKNITRNDSLGEFLNRPLFVMRTKLCTKSRACHCACCNAKKWTT